MWIRSQDKATLTYCTRLWANPYGYIQNLPATGIEDDFDILGEYKTKERALEVLGEIMQAIETEIENTVLYNGATCKGCRVFQMPEK